MFSVTMKTKIMTTMYIMNYRRIIPVLIICLAMIPSMAVGQTAIETRTLKKSFPVTEGMSLEVTNKYGKVHLSKTSADSVNIRIEMHASAPNQSKLKKLVDGVTFELNSTNYFIIAETRFLKGRANIFEGIRNITNNLISSESKVEINYYVMVPDFIDIKIDNRYGDIYVESTSCDLDIKMSNGNFNAEDLSGNNVFDLSFYDATINSCERARMNLSYGELKISEASDLNIVSSSSRIEIDSINNLRLDSKRDKYYIRDIDKIEGEGYFTEFEIEKIGTSAGLNTKYGSLRIINLEPGFSILSIDSDYTTIDISTLKGSSFNVDIKAVNCPVNLPGEWQLEEKTISEERKEYLYFGRTNIKESGSQVKINCERGKLLFYEK